VCRVVSSVCFICIIALYRRSTRSERRGKKGMKKANPLASFWISLSRSCMDQDDRWQKVDVISFYFSSTLLLAASTSHRPKSSSSSSSIHYHEPRRSVCLIREQVCSGRPLWGWAGSAREVEAGDWDRVARPGPAGRGRGGPSLSPFFRGG